MTITFASAAPDSNDSTIVLLQKWLVIKLGAPDTNDSKVILLQKLATAYSA